MPTKVRIWDEGEEEGCEDYVFEDQVTMGDILALVVEWATCGGNYLEFDETYVFIEILTGQARHWIVKFGMRNTYAWICAHPIDKWKNYEEEVGK